MEVLVVFKTHLDLGYTDLASNVMNRYMTDYIPRALDLAEALEGTEDSFIWTTGSYLIEQFMKTSSENCKRAEIAIEKGLIDWHALPYTMHVEDMNEPLFNYGFLGSKRLDERFGRKTIAAKITDVPGITRATVPLLYKAGVRMLHVGVNPYSAVPEVPEAFKWQAPTGEWIYVLYNKVYGEKTPIPGTDKIIYFAMTNDNEGPQTPEEVHKLYEKIRKEYPNAIVRAGTLNEAAEALLVANPNLPVISEEIGDSWAYGYQADPRKEASFRNMLRFAETLSNDEKNILYDGLLLTSEHTRGLSGAQTLKHDQDYLPEEFDACRSREGFVRIEKAWKEQREYINTAIDDLSPLSRGRAISILEETKRQRIEMIGEEISLYKKDCLGPEVSIGPYSMNIGIDGAIYGIKKEGKTILPRGSRAFGFGYEMFSYAETAKFCEQYGRDNYPWGYDDFNKRGLEFTGIPHMKTGAVLKKIVKVDENRLLLYMQVPQCFTTFGCPQEIYMEVVVEDDVLRFDFFWIGKRANRIPECIYLDIDNPGTGIYVRKLGEWIDPSKTVSRGGRALHGTDYGFRLSNIEIEMLDSSLVSFGSNVWSFNDRQPDKADYARIILYNNQWNTNFPFWYEEDARFRFELREYT